MTGGCSGAYTCSRSKEAQKHDVEERVDPQHPFFSSRACQVSQCLWVIPTLAGVAWELPSAAETRGSKPSTLTIQGLGFLRTLGSTSMSQTLSSDIIQKGGVNIRTHFFRLMGK